MDTDQIFHMFFMPWFLFHWDPLEDFGFAQFDSEKTIALNYVRAHEDRLNSMERCFIDEMQKSHYSFYSILNVEFEQSLVVKDILLGTTHTIKEREGTHSLHRGDIIFSCILTVDNQSIFVGMAPIIIPSHYHTNLIDFRKWMLEENENKPLSTIVLRDKFDVTLLDYFFDIMDDAYNKPLPKLQNTDGEPIQFSKSYFTLDIALEKTFERLLPLTLSNDPEEFLQDVGCDESGEIKRLVFPWLKKGNKEHKGWENTLMGNITLEDDKLILETNSEKRTQQGKKLLKKHLGKAVRFQQTLIETPEQKLGSSPGSDDTNQPASLSLQSPELQKKLKQIAKEHWENWLDKSIPALEDKIPREAAKTEAGKELLEALLLHFERNHAGVDENSLLKVDIPYLRSELALD